MTHGKIDFVCRKKPKFVENNSRSHAMLNRNTTRLGFISILLIGFVLGYLAAIQPSKSAEANQDATDSTPDEPTDGNAGTTFVALQTQDRSSTRPNTDRDVYYPGTEELGPDEMRVVALGTGMPTVRPKQAAACFLVELGNGDKFLFDIGYGSVERLSAMKIPMDYLDKVFIGHLHMDHFGDLDALWIGGVKMNRTYPLRVWGPSGGDSRNGNEVCH